MYELIQVGPQSYYIESPAKVGVYDTGAGVYLIDSGSDKDAGRRVRKVLDEQGWKALGVLVTHSNADHIGGCQYLQKQTGCRIFASGIEAQFTCSPLLEPSFLYGGYPPKPLRNKFLMAQPAEAVDIGAEGFPAEVKVLPLPGHFFDQVGFLTPDRTAYIADSISSVATLDKYRYPFIYDVQAYIDTLDGLEKLDADMFVPAHAEATNDIAPLAKENRRRVEAIADDVLAMCTEPHSTEEILKIAFDSAELELNFQQYVLVGSTLRSFLAWHLDAGRVAAEFDDNMLRWRRV